MAVLILGGAGYIGSHMVDQLITQGKEKVIVVDNLVTGHRQAVHSDAIFMKEIYPIKRLCVKFLGKILM